MAAEEFRTLMAQIEWILSKALSKPAAKEKESTKKSSEE
jgi:hypothetical protein